ncbi:MAG: hypothetical protein DRJ42_02370 [Deltaproteobacteria bacterium]|nr:MAG: hypothetical protein DRJ42_02370 [Deltaproteobacteria bacterium]
MKSSFIGALALVLLAIAAPALAQDARDQARQNFGAGVEAFEAGQYESALTSFQEAYRLAPHPSVRVNMANCYEHLRRPLEAMFHYEHFLTESPDAPPAQRAEVEEALRSLRGQVGEVTVRVVPDGALVRIDEAEVRRTPILHTIRMVPGSHLLEVRAEGYQSVRREFIVEGGQPADISIRLERGEDTVAEPLPVVTAVAPAEEGGAVAAEPDTAAQIDADPGDENPETNAPSDSGGYVLTTPTIIAGAATGAFLVGTVITGILALSANGDFDDAVARSNDPSLSGPERAQARQDGLDAQSSANTLSTLTDVFLVATIIGAGATTALFFLTQPDDEEHASRGPRIRGAMAAATPDGGAIVLSGEF